MTTLSPTAETSERLRVPLRGTAAQACGACADRLAVEVRALPGVTEASVDSATATLFVRLSANGEPETVSASAQAIGERLGREFAHRVFRVGGMDCEGCARSIEKTVASLPGVVCASVNFPAARLKVEFAPGSAGVNDVAVRTRALGFSVNEAGVAPMAAGDARARWFTSAPARVAASGLLLGAGLIAEHVLRAPGWVSTTLLALSLLAGGGRFALAGLRALRSRTIGTNLLMAVAAGGAVLIGHWEEAAGVVFLYALGEALEGAAMERTRASLAQLIDAAPAEAVLRRPDGSEQIVPAAELAPGDRIVVRPGAKIAADGQIVAGASAVAEAAITGESLPREKASGDAVYAGSLNGNGALIVRVTAVGEDSTLARILHLVEAAQAQKAPAQALVERFGRVYTPLVLASALLLAVVGSLVQPGGNWLYRALTLLVVSCPCALVIATPVAYVCGIARAAKNGVLIKGGAHLESLAGVRHVAWDKTGTLTTGHPRVTDVAAMPGVEESTLLATAAAAERLSDHPLARAIVEEAGRRGISPFADVRDAVAVPGRGVAAVVNGVPVLVGTPNLLTHRSGVAVPDELQNTAERLADEGKTLLFVARAGVLLGLVALADTPRTDAAPVLETLRRLHVGATILTGDSAPVAQTVGRALGIGDVRAGLLPEEKLAATRELAEQRPGGVAFVGDGINDAPALAAATVGIAMGANGTAAALEAADVALMTNDLSRLPFALRLARQTRAVVRQNVAVALGAVVVLLVTTVAGSLPLPLAVLGHEGSALLVILNGLRLLSPRLTRLT